MAARVLGLAAIRPAERSRIYLAPSIQLYGAAADLERLAGEWWGDYVGDRGGQGTITFTLIAGRRVAHGDVLTMRQARAASIRFVNAMDGSVNGELDPHWDRERNTLALLTFRGVIGGDAVGGTFTTRYANGAGATTGQWKVARVARFSLTSPVTSPTHALSHDRSEPEIGHLFG